MEQPSQHHSPDAQPSTQPPKPGIAGAAISHPSSFLETWGFFLGLAGMVVVLGVYCWVASGHAYQYLTQQTVPTGSSATAGAQPSPTTLPGENQLEPRAGP